MIENEDAQANHISSAMNADDGIEGRTSTFEGGGVGGEENRTKKAVREPDEARTVGKSTSKREGLRWSTKGTLFNGRRHRAESGTRENMPSEGRKIGVFSASKSVVSDSGSVTSHGDLGEASNAISPTTSAELALKNRELEDALQYTRREQARMQEELEQYRQQAGLYEEDIRAYKEESRQDHEVGSRPTSSCSFLEQERNLELIGLADEREFWKRRYGEVNQDRARQEKDLRAQLAMRKEWEMKTMNLTADLDRAQRSNHEAQRHLDHRNDEIRELQRQVLDLKRSISTSTRTEGQVTDDVFREHIQRLGHDLQNWIINNFRRAKLGRSSLFSSLFKTDCFVTDMSTLSELSKSAIQSAVPTYKSLILSNRLAVIQAFVSKILVDEIFQCLFFGLPEDRIEQFLAMDEYMKSIGKLRAIQVANNAESDV
jgi:hypothetical protein